MGEFSAVTAGGSYSCGLRADATITCWGSDGFGAADAPGGAFSAVAAGGEHSCGLRTDATIICWGRNDHGEADAPGGAFSAVSAGGSHSCGLRADATITCWGYNGFGQADAPGGAGSSVVDGGVPDGTPGGGEQVPDDPSVVDTDVEPGTVVDGLAKVSGLRYDFGAERAVWEPVPGARSYLLAMWDGEQSRQLNVECCSFIIYLSQSDVEQINVRASNNSVNNPVEGPWSGWVNLLPEKVSDLTV